MDKADPTHAIDVESTSGTAGTAGQRYLVGADQRGPVNGGAGGETSMPSPGWNGRVVII